MTDEKPLSEREKDYHAHRVATDAYVSALKQDSVDKQERIRTLERELAEANAQLEGWAEGMGVLWAIAMMLGIEPDSVDSDNAMKMGHAIKKEIQSLRAHLEAYNELIYAVESAFPHESRHETALRYIRQTERRYDSGHAKESSDE